MSDLFVYKQHVTSGCTTNPVPNLDIHMSINYSYETLRVKCIKYCWTISAYYMIEIVRSANAENYISFSIRRQKEQIYVIWIPSPMECKMKDLASPLAI